MSEHDSELQVVSRSRDGRRRYDEKGKRALVEAALRPGMSVARLAQEHGVNANLLRKWITKYLLERESDRCAKDGAVVVDSGDGVRVRDGVPVAPQGETSTPAFVPVVAAAAVAPSVPSNPIAFALNVRLPNGVEFNLGQAGIDELSTLVQMFGRLPCSGSTTN